MSEIFMIRHGQASFGKENYDRLSDTGIAQSELLARYLCGRGIEFHSVYTGYLKRQQDTALTVLKQFSLNGITISGSNVKEGFDEYSSTEIIKTYLPQMIKEDPSLAEDSAKIFTDRKSFQKIFEGAMTRWINDKNPPEQIESRPKFRERVSFALQDVMQENGQSKNILIFASGGSICAVVQYVLGISDGIALQLGWQIVNASVTRFKYAGNRIMIHSFNCYDYLLQEDKRFVTYR